MIASTRDQRVRMATPARLGKARAPHEGRALRHQRSRGRNGKASAPTRVEMSEPITLGERIADNAARIVGSWRFIIIQSILVAIWIAINVIAWGRALLLVLQCFHTADGNVELRC